MTVRILQDSDIENAFDDPERIGRPAGLFPPRGPDCQEGNHGHQHDAPLSYLREHGVDVEGRMTTVEDTASAEVRSLR